MSWTKTEQKTLAVITSCGGSISFVCSFAMMIAILGSKVKLSTTYRRLFFGMIAFDIIKSVSYIFSSYAMPKGLFWGAIGNDATCTIQAFFTHTGMIGSCFYSLAISICFFVVINCKRPRRNTKRLEMMLHIVTILCAIVSAIILFATGNFGPSGVQCWLAPKHPNFRTHSNLEHTTYGDPGVMRWIFVGFPFYFVYTMNCFIMFLIWRGQLIQAKKNLRYRLGWTTTQNFPAQSTIIEHVSRSDCNATRFANVPANHFTIAETDKKRMKHIRDLAYAFALGFFLIYFFSMTYRLIEMYGISEPPFVIVLLCRITCPLHGFVNMIIYTYPHVQSYHCNNPSHNIILSWIQAFWHVIKNGGDSDSKINKRLSLKRYS
mmetsp:Transcript_6380/g.9269  ORF Transcript_6380/g.9269 Transcript_6380/m.9269 type:complete len:376 (+) Transcript_6380:64-1191(+)